MPASLAAVGSVVERLWPASGAESWDATGLVTGDPGDSVSRILLAVDAVDDTVAEAIADGADLLVTHHPLLLRGVTSVAEDRYKGALIARLIRANCALLTAHTNADVTASGTSAVLAARLGLTGVHPIVPRANLVDGLGRVGRLPVPTTLGQLARLLGRILPATASGVRVSGSYDHPITTVAVCGGAGDSLLSEPAVRSADVYITSDLRHHPASEAKENSVAIGGPALIDVSHWASEWLWLDTAAEQLAAGIPEVDVSVSQLRTDPWDFVVVQ